jgi:flagellar hook-associated protein 2
MFSIDGIVSGLDTTSIIEGMLSIQQRQVDQLSARKARVVQEQTAFKSIESKLVALRSTLSQLARSQNNVFGDRSAAVSQENLLAAAAGNGAAEGVYYLRVNSLARAHQIASQGYASADSGITQGSLTLQQGDADAVTVTIGPTNNTLQGLADAINAATDDVTATIVNDGSGATPYRLLLTGSQTGQANAITVTNNLAGSSGDLVRPDFSGAAVQDAADASVTLGTGAGAMTVTHATNEIEDLISGVTLKLLGADAGQEITLTVSRDTESATTAVTDFVDAFNDLMDSIDNQVRYDAESGQAAVLLGNRSAVSLQDKIRSAVTGVVQNVDAQMNRLSALGITVSDTGRLVVDSAKLDDALAGRLEGVSETDLKRLFALDGESSHAGVRFILGSTRTQASQTPYQVDITQAAERASMLASQSLVENTTLDASNNTFTLTVDGVTSGTLTLTSGTYTRSALAAHVQEVIDADSELKDLSVTVTLDGNSLRITSGTYGSESEVAIGTGTALDELGFTGTETDRGQDVAGKFIVNGVDELATGSGRLLIGDADNAHTGDVQLRVTLGSGDVQAGAEANLTVTRGLASRLDQILGEMLDPIDGELQTVDDGYVRRLEDLDEGIARFNDLMESRRESLVEQFAALEAAIAQLQSTSSFLSAQLTSLTSQRR